MTKGFLSIIVARVILFGAIMAALQSSAVLQVLALIVLNVTYMILLMRYKPFVSFVVQFLANVTGKKLKKITFRMLLFGF